MNKNFFDNRIYDIFNKERDCSEGHLASYIPELAKVNPNLKALSIITENGEEINIGNYNYRFTIQSISKIFLLALALMDNSEEEVFSKISVEPTGDPFNSTLRLETNQKIFNPFINAGALASASMIKGKNAEEKIERLKKFISNFTERADIDISDEIYQSEYKTANKNRAISYLLKSIGVLETDVEDNLAFYTMACSIILSVKDLAKAGLVFALGGINSKGERILPIKICKIMVALMTTCGMYDHSGSFATSVGIPAKSGVSGGILGVVPKKMGICSFSPIITEQGNSIIGVEIYKDLSNIYELNIF